MEEEAAKEILIVEDNPTNLRFLSTALSIKGIKVRECKRGKAALESIEKKLPDLILLDINMPEMDGFEVCRQIKSNEKSNDIPVIFLTAQISQDDVLKGFEIGAVDYITKPFRFPELFARVKTHLELRQKKQELEKANSSLEEKVELRTKQLQKANNRLARLDKAKNDFLLLINHELRTPVNGILGFSNMLKRNPTPQKRQRFITFIDKLADRLARISELALLFTSLQAQSYQVMLRPVGLKDIIHKAIENISNKEKAHTQDIEVEIHQEDLKISVDKNLMLTCLHIVLDNAIKYTQKGGKIKITTNCNGNFTQIKISDNGPGFTSEALKKAFALFGADNLDYNSYGFGLGLATAKLIMDTMGGNIMVENANPHGAVVIISLDKNVFIK